MKWIVYGVTSWIVLVIKQNIVIVDFQCDVFSLFYLMDAWVYIGFMQDMVIWHAKLHHF